MSPHSLLELSSLSELSPNQLADFIQLLISHEVMPGGPYTFHTNNDAALNQKIYQLLNPHEPTQRSTKFITNTHWESVMHLAQSFLQGNITIYNQFLQIYSHLIKTDSSGEISHLSRTFYTSLQKRYKKKILPNEFLSSLDKANVYIWVAYSIYDKILDEKSHQKLLPFANQLYYEALSIYQHCAIDTLNIKSTKQTIQSYFTRIHLENSFESNKAKSVSILKKNLSNRSILHCLGPMIIAHTLFSSKNDINRIDSALSQYCAARQLLDDIHDWREDLENHRKTYVVARLIRDLPHKNSDPWLIPSLSQHFFQETAEKLLSEVYELTQAAQTTLEDIALASNSSFVLDFITPLQKSAEVGTSQQKFTHEFLKAYSNTSPNS